MSSEPELGTETTEPDNINIGLIATIAVVGALLVVSITAALTALVRTEAARYSDEVGAYANLGEVSRLKEAQRGKLSEGPQWADRAKGLASIPIDRAMRLVVTDLERNPNLATPWKPGEEPDAGAPEQGEAPTGAASAGTAAPGEASAGVPAGSAAGETGMAEQGGTTKTAEKAPPAEGASAGAEKKPAAAETARQGADKGATPMTKQPEASASGVAPAPPQE